MDKNFKIYIFVIIICIVIFLFYFMNINKNVKNKESFSLWDSNIKPNFVTNYENINFNTAPDYKYQNITEYNFKRLFDKIEIVNKEKINLKERTNYTFYTQSTTDDKLRMNLDMISKYVILILNDDKYYDFNKTNFGDVEIWIDKDGNEELRYELFLWDKKNYFEIKLWINIIKFVHEKDAENYGVRWSNYLFPDFNIGLPFKDQIIPLPTDVIITGHFDTSVSSIKPNEPVPIKYLYLNQIEIQNSTLIVDYHKNKYPFNQVRVNETGFSGITDSSLEYVNILNKSVDSPYLESGRKYNKWPTLDEEPKWKAQYPAKFPPIKKWDADGVYYYEKEAKNVPNLNIVTNNPDIEFTKEDTKQEVDRYCDVYEPGTRWSQDKEPLQPYFWPGNYTVDSTCGENYWLFNNTGNPEGTFFGGGKR